MRIGAAPLGVHVRDLMRDVAHAPVVAAGPASVARYAADVLLAKAMNTVAVPRRDAPRTIALRGGGTLTYRLNRGDLASIREILVEDHYGIGGAAADAVVDLGANVGITALLAARRLRPRHLVCVEPDPVNAALVRHNLAANGVAADVLEAAVGAHDGTARFATAGESNLGRVADAGMEVRLLSMGSVLASLPPDARVSLLKVDVEGAEEALLSGPCAWLERVDRVVMEIHADRVDVAACVRPLEAAGLRRVRGPVHEVWTFARPR